MDITTQIELECPECKRRCIIEREGDEPADAVLVRATCEDCEIEHMPRYFDVLGGEIEWDDGEPDEVGAFAQHVAEAAAHGDLVAEDLLSDEI